MNLRSIIIYISAWVLLSLSFTSVSHAVTPDEILDDPKLEQRARDISIEIRCLVCRNQSIDDSDADLAKDLRIIIRERLLAGDNDTEVKKFLVDRYGEFVLLKPQMGLIWFIPIILLVIGVVIIIIFLRKHRNDDKATKSLSDKEQKILNDILGK